MQIVDTPDRAAVGMMLGGLDGNIDVIVPRGGKGLVGRVQEEARVPVFAHLDGVCHVYVHENASLDMARNVLLNAKMRRTGICGAAETLLVDKACADTHLAPLIAAPVSYTHLRAHETDSYLVCRLLLEKKDCSRWKLSSTAPISDGFMS